MVIMISLTRVALHFFHSYCNYRFIVCMAFQYSKDFIVTNSSFNDIHGNTLTTHNHIYGEFPICRQIVAKLQLSLIILNAMSRKLIYEHQRPKFIDG